MNVEVKVVELFYGKEFGPDSAEEMTQAMKGKTVTSVSTDYTYDDLLVLHFADDTELVIRYDWIYAWDVMDSKG